MRCLLFTLFSCILLFALFPPTPGYSQQQPRDLAKLFYGIDLRVKDSAFISPPREIVRPMLRCKKLMLNGEYAEAVEILGEILADDTIEDFLVPRGTRSFTSLRARTESILGAIDEKLLEPYRIRYNIRARKMMEKGVAENDLSILKEVSSRFFFTDSGAECTMLLGHMELSNGQPSAAQSYFAKIIGFPSTAARHDPEASILLATCQMLGNNLAATKETLVGLKRRMPNSTVTLMGENYTLFNRDDEAVSWLTSLIGDSPLASNQTISKWLMFQGNPARTGKTGTGMPLIVARWEQATINTIEGQQAASAYVKSLVRQGTMPAPAVQPLIVGDTIVLRGVDQMYGIDFETGLRKWAWPPQLSWNEQLKKKTSRAHKSKIKQRFVADAIYGQASSDGRLIFFVPAPGGSSRYEHSNEFGAAAESDPLDLRTYNELVAIDSVNSGLLRWRVGGPSGLDEPKLAKAFFIGEALPLEGVLYCCCVKDNAVQLVAIDSITGKLRWAQPIADYDEGSFSGNSTRRLAGVSPSYADGKIVCMTGTGAVVAVDVSTHTLQWGYQYKRIGKTTVVSDNAGYSSSLKDTWRDSQVTIANGKVILTPVLSRQMICLDLEDGLDVWFEEDGFTSRLVNRESSLYLAGVNQDLLILVGTRDVRGINMFSGREAWRLLLEASDLPSGRGYIGKNSLYLPTSSRKVLRIDLVKGEIAESVTTSRILGNLSRVKGDVISHGVDHVASYPEFHASKKLIDDVSADELTEAQKFVKSQTLIQQGELKSGLDLLIEIAEQNRLQKYAQLLESCTASFEDDQPAIAVQSFDALKRLYPDFNVESLEQNRAIAKLRAGEFHESVEMSLVELETKFEKIKTATAPEIKDDVFKSVAARLIDGSRNRPAKTVVKNGIEQLDFGNRHDVIGYSAFGWHRARMILGLEGLQRVDPKGFSEAKGQLVKLVRENIDQPAAQLDWLLARVPLDVLDVETMEILGRRFLKENRFLVAMQCANIASSVHPKNSERIKLLKAEILLAGNDLFYASKTIDDMEPSDLNEGERESLSDLKEKVSTAIKASANSVRSSANWTDSQWPIADGQVVTSSKVSKQANNRYRLPFRVGEATDPRFSKLRMFFCPWGNGDVEFEMRNSYGNRINEMRIQGPDDDGIGSTYLVHIDIQNHIAEFSLDRSTYYVDWFNVLSGAGGRMWKVPLQHVTPDKTAFSGARETVVNRGDDLYCYESLTGKLIWKRKMKDDITRIVSHGSQLTTWSESTQNLNTIDVATGKLKRTLNAKRYLVSRVVTDKLVMSYPIRKAELSKAELAKYTGPGKPENPAKVATRIAVFDPDTGQVSWSKVFRLDSKRFYLRNEICHLESNGKMSFIDLASGDVSSEIQLPMSGLEQATMQGVTVREHRAGWVVHVKCGKLSPGVFRGKARYRFDKIHDSLGSGPVYLIDQQRTSLVWESPAHVERMEYMNSQPFDSPAIMFGRHIQRNQQSVAESHHLNFVLLDAKTGKLVCNEIVESYENFNGHAVEWKQSQTDQPSNTLVISTPSEVKEFKFVKDAELPPTPHAWVTFNAIDFFKDPLFDPIRNEIVDSRIEEFRERAQAAEKRREEQRARAAAELKKRMGLGDTK